MHQQNDVTTTLPKFEDGTPIPTDADNPRGWRGPLHALHFPFNWVSASWCEFHSAIPDQFKSWQFRRLRGSWACPDCGLKIELVTRKDAPAMVEFLHLAAELLTFVECSR